MRNECIFTESPDFLQISVISVMPVFREAGPSLLAGVFFIELVGHRYGLVSIKVGASHYSVRGKKATRQRREGQFFIEKDMGSDQCNQLNFNTIFVLKGYS